jgi:L-ascorbate metabolism protein UlaG (beta-lactamase superfamily)
MRRPRRRIALVGGVLLVLALGAHLGWFRRCDPWARATGWDRLSADERPVLVCAAHAIDEPDVGWLGHSGFRITWGGTILLLDPNTSPWCTLSRRVLEPAAAPSTLGPADAVLISHTHFDHFDVPTLRALGPIGLLALPSGSETVLEHSEIVVRELRPLRAGDRVTVGALEIVAVPAAHNSSRLHPFRGRAAGLGYVIRRGACAVYFAGDTGAALDFARIGREHAPRIAILPIGAFAPRFPMRYYHLDPEEAVEAAVALGVERVIPCHFGTFALSLDAPDAALPRFAEAARARGVRWEMPRLLTPREATGP